MRLFRRVPEYSLFFSHEGSGLIYHHLINFLYNSRFHEKTTLKFLSYEANAQTSTH